jgi:protein JSN1
MAAVITLHSVRLATNANGALLLTWLLDTCNFPNRFKTLAPRLVTHLAKLCTHKLASLTVLKLINQRSEPEAREVILNALFTSEDENKVLKRILEDQIHGAAVIYKVLTSPFVADQSSAERRSQYIAVVRNMLQKLKVQPTQGYKRLMDEVGLADRTVATPPINGHRGPQRSTTPREYATPNTFAPGQFYSPQHTYTTSQQYVPQQQMDLLRTSQTDPSLLGLEIQGLGQIYSPQQLPTQHHQHQDSAQAAYQYQQMLLLQQQQQRTFNGYSSSPSASQQQQTSHQQMYQPSPSAAQQSQFGGPLMSGQNLSPQGMGVYSVNGGGGTSPGYPFAPGDVYSANRRGQR